MGEERWKQEFMEGLAEGFAGVPMDFPEGIRPLGEFQTHVIQINPDTDRETGRPIEDISVDHPGLAASPNLDDEVIDAEIIE
jgi:hypothetical protein